MGGESFPGRGARFARAILEIDFQRKAHHMSKVFAAALAMAATLGVTAPALAADAHSHDSHSHSHAAPQKLTLDHGKKWATDEALRRGMGDIRAAFAGKHARLHKGTLTPAEYAALGQTVVARVGDIVANCKLAPEADANLHVVVAELLAASDAMQGKAAVEPAKGAIKAVHALNEYGRYFDHPGWKALR